MNSEHPATAALPPVPRSTLATMRWSLVAVSVPALLAGVALSISPERAETDFAWSIKVPITSAFLGAAYLAAVFLPLLSSRERIWARARTAVPVVTLFATLGLVASLVHLEQLNFDGPTGLSQVATWLWIAPYVVFPPLLLALLARQLTVQGGDPSRVAPIPRWARLVLALQAVVLLGLGILLFLGPQSTRDDLWPWKLTPLTGKVVGAWLVALGLGAVLVNRENDWTRIRAAALSYALFGGFEIATLARYSDAVDWGGVGVYLYALVLITMLLVGGYAWVAGRTTRTVQGP